MKAICRVCELLDNDKTIKEVYYCEMCKASMCKECEGNWLRRGMAAIKEKQMKSSKMKTINIIIGTLATLGALYSIYNGDTTNGLILLILAKLYTDGSTNR